MSKTYIRQILDEVNNVSGSCGPVLFFGENIDTGSRIAGLARGVTVNPAGRILNVGNCELTHIGMGLGMMLDGGCAVVFMKQLDFLLLGLDQMVNTFNIVRSCPNPESLGSFTIFVIVCDQGYQGPQSSLNAASDFASLANISAYCLNGAADAQQIVGREFVHRGGFRMICVSQRLFGAPAIEAQPIMSTPDHGLFQYASGGDLTMACYNFSLRDGLDLSAELAAAGVRADLFHVNYVPDANLEPLFESCARTRRLVILDDSKAVMKFGDRLATELASRGIVVDLLLLGRRGSTTAEYGVCLDRFIPDAESVLSFVQRTVIQSA